MSDLDIFQEAIAEARSIMDEALKGFGGGEPKQADLHKEFTVAKMTVAGMDAFVAKYGDEVRQRQEDLGMTARKRRGG